MADETEGRGASHARRIASDTEIGPGMSKKFTLKCGGRRIEAMLINSSGSYHAYVNVCRHVPITLDWVENHFFTRDKKFIVCANHGALYVPDTGECVWGPPIGESLVPVPIEVKDGAIFAMCPESPDF